MYYVNIHHLGKFHTKIFQNERFMCKKLILVTFPMSQLLPEVDERVLKHFITQEHLSCITLQMVSGNYTLMDSHYNKSFLDHFLVSSNVDCQNISVIHDGDNLSDHEPLIMELEYHVNSMQQKSHNKFISNWENATAENIQSYKSLLNHQMANFELPASIVTCNDFSCS